MDGTPGLFASYPVAGLVGGNLESLGGKASRVPQAPQTPNHRQPRLLGHVSGRPKSRKHYRRPRDDQCLTGRGRGPSRSGGQCVTRLPRGTAPLAR